MPDRLPPLTALRTFVVAARYESYVRAAEELNVTSAAVSHQIKVLEDFLGTALFLRQSRGVRLTEAAQSVLPDLQLAFDQIKTSMNKLQTRRSSQALVVSVVPSFAIKWLVPRLDGFASSHPDIDVRISASRELVDLRQHDIDLAIRFGSGNYPGLTVVELFREEVVPLYNPALNKSLRPLLNPSDLRYHTLLHDDSVFFDAESPDWASWLQAAGVTDIDASLGLRFNTPEHALQAAVSGAGVVLSRRTLAQDDILNNRLKAPFELSLPMRPAYYAATSSLSLKQPKVRKFWDWLQSEAKISTQSQDL